MRHTLAQHHAGRIRRAGFTLVETAISAFVLILLSGALTQALIRMRGVTEVTDLRTQMQDSAERITNLIISDARRSGFVTVAGLSYPHLFNDGVAGVGFTAHGHAAATEHAAAGDADFGVNREIVLAQPLIADPDNDGKDKPQLDPTTGVLLWSNNVISYIVVTGADGVNYLERRVNAANPRRIAPYVERITFDDNGSLFGTVPFGSVPVGAVRVRIWFRRPDDAGHIYRYSTDFTVSLRNG